MVLSRFVRLQDHFKLNHGWVSVADGDQEVDELDQQVVHLLVVDDAPVVCITLPDDVRLAEAEQAGQALPDVTLPDPDILAV